MPAAWFIGKVPFQFRLPVSGRAPDARPFYPGLIDLKFREDLVLFAIKTCRTMTVSYLVPKSVLAQTPIPGMDRSDRPRLLWFYVKARPISELHHRPISFLSEDAAVRLRKSLGFT